MATFTAINCKRQSGGAMRGTLDYMSQKKKTLWGDAQLVVGHNCVPQSAYTEMLTTKQQFRKTEGRQFYHFVQSFAEDDPITPAEANAIGLELAQREFPGFEVVIATHVDTNHIHNHLVVNSVSCMDGKKLHQSADDLLAHRKANDEICQAHGLSILERPEKQSRMKRMKPGEYQAGLYADSWKLDLIQTINDVLEYAGNPDEFIDGMEREGYQVIWTENRKQIADEETVQKIITALENESLKYETYYKLIIVTGMRWGECCGLKWSDIDFERNSIHIQRNVVKLTGEEVFTKPPKTAAGDRYVYFSPEMESLLKEYRQECDWQADAYENRKLTEDDFVFRKHYSSDPMTPSSFTWRFKLILKKNGLPEKLNVHSLRHSNASLLIANGTDVATVASLLGHSQPSTTLDIYTHAFDKNKKAASETLQQSLEI